jgi:hypothetical protein
MCVRIHDIVIPPNIIGGVIHKKIFRFVDAVSNNPDCLAVIISEILTVDILIKAQQPGKKMILEFQDKGLKDSQLRI